MTNKKITKAVITAAGYGTRFLPATKNQPKEMLPLIDKPIIHYLVEEAVNSGITDIILVTRTGGNVLEDYFDNNYQLEAALEKAGKADYLKMIRDIPKMANVINVRQRAHLPYGNGTPLLASKELIGDDESVLYMFGDDLTISKTPCSKQLIDTFTEHGAAAVLAVQEVPWDEIERYGSVRYKKNAPYEFEIEEVLEKLPKEEAPSNKAQFGRFVLSHKVIEEALQTQTGIGGELWLTDILNNLAHKGEKVIAQPIEGEWLTTGDPLRYLKATLKFAYQRDDLKADLDEFIKNELI